MVILNPIYKLKNKIKECCKHIISIVCKLNFKAKLLSYVIFFMDFKAPYKEAEVINIEIKLKINSFLFNSLSPTLYRSPVISI